MASFREAAFTLLLLPILVAVFALAWSGPLVEAFVPLELGLGLAGAAWVGAVLLAQRGAGSLRVVVAGAIALRVLALVGDPGLSDDANRIVWEGAVVLEGKSPYALAPADPALAQLAARFPELHARVNHPEVPAAYPPLTQAVGVATVAAGRALGVRDGRRLVLGLRWTAAVCDLLVLAALIALLGALGRPRSLAVVWGWSPLAAVEFAGSAHHDALAILLLVVALLVLREGRRGPLGVPLGLVALAGAALAKPLALAALPFALRARDTLARIAFLLVLVALAWAPLLVLEGGVRPPWAGLGEYALRWEASGVLFPFVRQPVEALAAGVAGLDPRLVARGLALAAWLALAALLFARRTPTIRATGALIGAFLVLSPTLHPWYVTWVLPFVALGAFERRGAVGWLGNAPWLWLAASAFLLYAPLVARERWGAWLEPSWLWPVVHLPFLALLIASLTWRGRAAVEQAT